ncbi:MAG: sigma-54-dependent Fis family transcriptional regulator [bacterium]|nr:sigma-54-dependent Fis family transcriptional regulator [bacterium]MCP4800510.1 sigma-54-dependent Fis family transcriptional regulator [bacterium]
MAKILIVDDVAGMRESYQYDISRLTKYKTDTAVDGKDAIEKLSENNFDCVILDLEMPRADGFDVLRYMKSRADTTPVIVYTGTGNYQNCIKAVQLGAFGFVDKADPIESVLQNIKHALDMAKLEKDNVELRNRLAGKTTLLGKSEAMLKLKADIKKLAPLKKSALILGPSGSGKELVVAELHRHSSDKNDKPLEIVLCSAIPAELIESNLFGHEKGSFTGADNQKLGAFELADGGTLFLDEIGELPLEAQAKLLRVLENKTIRRVGGTKDIEIDVRVVAATHQNLEEKVTRGEFRQDLLYRLNTHVLNIPPLQERLSDIPILVNHFMKSSCEEMSCKFKTVSEEAMEALMAYSWKHNNVRELINAVERMVFNCDDDIIEMKHLPAEITGSALVSNSGSFEYQVSAAKKQILTAALERNNWHLTNTAKELELADHSSLTKIMKRLGLK